MNFSFSLLYSFFGSCRGRDCEGIGGWEKGYGK